MKKILLIGNLLSKQKGTKGVSEHLIDRLSSNLQISSVSRFDNKFLRIIDIICAIIFYRGKILHVDVFSGPAFIISEVAVFFGFLFGKKNILTLRGGNLINFTKSNNLRFRNLVKKADYIQTPSLYLKRYFETNGVKIHYLPNSIKLDNFPFTSNDFNEHSLLWVRAFDSTYNPEIPVRILNELIKSYPNTTLTMIGPDKGELSKVLKIIEKLGLNDKINIIGPVPNNELYKYFHKSQIFLNTTSFESFGVCLIEAASCGIPIVSNSVGEIDVLWEDNLNIMKVYDNNINQYVSKIVELIENRELYDDIKSNAKKMSESFSWERIKPKWLHLFNNF